LTSTRIELSQTKSTVDDLASKLNGKMTIWHYFEFKLFFKS
jgi:hypothetical protein